MHTDKETNRLEAFSDGVFAIAITLLILDIKVPPTGTPLAEGLLKQWPQYLAYVLSFITILVMWTGHHRLFLLIRRTNQISLILNGLLLMMFTIVPFPTSVLAAHIQDTDNGSNLATALYAGIYGFIGVFYNLLWWYAAYQHRLIDQNLSKAFVREYSRRSSFIPLIYFAAMGLAFVNIIITLVIMGALIIYFAISELFENPITQ